MDYEQKYKEILERAKKELQTCGSTDCDAARQIFRFFPELKESEDEKIRKELLQHCLDRRDGKQICVDASDYRRWAAWLEKQGEQKSIDMSIKEKAHQIAWETSKHYDPLLSKESWCEMAALDMASWLEKQCKQDALKSLPKWNKATENKKFDKHVCVMDYYMVPFLDTKVNEDDYYIELSDLKTLPKEE